MGIKKDKNLPEPPLAPPLKGGGSDSELESKCAEYLDGWKRALADYENLKRDQSKNLEDTRRRIKESFVSDLIPVLDNFDQALNHAPEVPEAESWIEGVRMIQKQFVGVLAELGVELILTEGEKFNPNLHEAVGARSEPDKAEDVILEGILSGYRLGEHVIRPAKVIINSKE
ncbi:MAG: nucleotide exchange factor GrpE [Candidatus Uhrbacteria bacterium]|nr:nucleotide exchange factor GrpE [Candidatus Uhrbacteria bacterium]